MGLVTNSVNPFRWNGRRTKMMNWLQMDRAWKSRVKPFYGTRPRSRAHDFWGLGRSLPTRQVI